MSRSDGVRYRFLPGTHKRVMRVRVCFRFAEAHRHLCGKIDIKLPAPGLELPRLFMVSAVIGTMVSAVIGTVSVVLQTVVAEAMMGTAEVCFGSVML